jgi:hypothetical protein
MLMLLLLMMMMMSVACQLTVIGVVGPVVLPGLERAGDLVDDLPRAGRQVLVALQLADRRHDVLRQRHVTENTRHSLGKAPFNG